MYPKMDHVYETNPPNQRYSSETLNMAADNFASLLLFFDRILCDYLTQRKSVLFDRKNNDGSDAPENEIPYKSDGVLVRSLETKV